MKNQFGYLGQTFEPLRNFKGGEGKFTAVMHRVKASGISNYKGDDMSVHNHISSEWSYNTFMTLSKIETGKEVDIYLMNGKNQVVPCSNELFQLKN